MRLTFVLPFSSRRPIGGLRVVYELANALVQRGHSVTVVHPRRLPGLAKPAGMRNAISRLVDRATGSGGVGWMAVDPRVRLLEVATVEAAAIPDSDVIVATNRFTAAPLAPLPDSKGLKCHLVMDFYPYMASRPELEESWRSGMKLLTISDWLRDMVLDAGVTERDVASISCGVSPMHRLKLPVEGRPASLSIMYGLGNYKAPSHAVAAMAAVHAALPNVPIKAFGVNSSRRPRELPDCVEYRPLLSDAQLSDLYNESAVFASASVAEGFCLPAAEAMASGCAVVATNSGGILDFAVHGRNCLLSDPGKPADLAANIVAALGDESIRTRLARSGLETIREYTWARSAGKLEAFVTRP